MSSVICDKFVLSHIQASDERGGELPNGHGVTLVQVIQLCR